LAAVILFAPANALMGMVAPYLAKLRLTNLEQAGSRVGRLYAAGTVGSIVGTFAAGYWLIAWLGNRSLGLGLVAGLVAVAVLASPRGYWWWRAGLVIAAAGALLLGGGPGLAGLRQSRLVYDGDSAYSRLRVMDVATARPQRLLVTDNMAAQSGVYLDGSGEPLFAYMKRFVAAAAADERAPERVLVIGGGAYTLPGLLLARYPNVLVDVVEIDPKVDELAERFFGWRPDGRVRIVHQDGRVFLNANRTEYDLIFMDAFTSLVPPFQLTTAQAVERLSAGLAPDGAVVVNLIAARTGRGAALAKDELATYRRQFGLVAVGPAEPDLPPELRQNLILVAGGSGGRAGRIATGLGVETGPVFGAAGSGRVLTDDFAPVERLLE